jgi:lysophospholipase L1-like esterase
MNAPDARFSSAIPRILLLGAGLILLLSAAAYNESVLGRFDPNPPLDDATVGHVRTVRPCFLLSGLALMGVAAFAGRISWLATLMGKPLTGKMLLAGLVVFLPLFILEAALRPVAYVSKARRTTIFAEDGERGWKLRANAEDVWGGVRVKINGKGLRGPELDYAKPADAYRILYLGDSVTFGYKLESHEQTFPYLMETILEDRLGREIETINGGVGGYSPWQEYLFLANEGIKYDPDLVVVSFVLNDVTEKFGLVRFGGIHRGYQLLCTVSSHAEPLLDRSALVYCARRAYAKMKYGKDVEPGARREQRVNVRSLAYYPEHPGVEKAWELTLENLGKIFDFCKARDVPVVLFVFPFTFQFRDIDGLSEPQETVCRFAREHQVPAIDLLPVLSEKLHEQQARPEDYFLDDDHPSATGSIVIAEALSRFVEREGVLARGQDGVARLH